MEEVDGIIWWTNNSLGRYIARLGYQTMFYGEKKNDRK
jgi:hypothetical protein